MKKITFLFTLCLFWVSSMQLLAAFAPTPGTSYVLIQSYASSGKLIGANGSIPSVKSADISVPSQRLTFELVSGAIYYVKNGDNNYLTCTSGGVLGFSATTSTDAQWTITETATSNVVWLRSVSASTKYLTTSTDVTTGLATFTGLALSLTTTVPTNGTSGAFKLATASSVFANLLTDAGFENAIVGSAPLGEWVDDNSTNGILGGAARGRIFTSYPSAGANTFMLRYCNIAAGNNGYYNINP